MRNTPILPVLFLATCRFLAGQQPAAGPGTAAEPVRVLNAKVDLNVLDGRLRPAIGTETIQVLRANRAHPAEAASFGWTYNHAPMLAYAYGRFYLEYLSNPFGEHLAPGHTLVANSADGRAWETPREVFPMYLLRPGSIMSIESGMAMMHQRMGFYMAPNGRLLVLGFYGHAPNVFGKGGLGRAVREARRDGSYGPIYFIRYNSIANQSEKTVTGYPFYKHSPDQGFVEACDALLANKLVTMQWWEEDRSEDGFFAIDPGHEAPSVYHRRDGMAVVVWKQSWAALSSDEGKSWSDPVRVPSIVTDGAKVWGQKTADGRYALVYNPANDGSHRWPLAVVTGDDGITFDNMLLVDGEVAPRRYIGRAKDLGLQYVRGISEGNGVPPGSDLWVTYSENKEDIWVSRVPVPIRFKAAGPVSDTFDRIAPGGELADWNIRRGKWTPVAVAAFPSAANHSLQLEDRDPYDYARAERVFPEAATAAVTCSVYPHQSDTGCLCVEVVDAGGRRPVRIVFGSDGHVRAADGEREVDAGAYRANAWTKLSIAVDASTSRYDVSLDGRRAVTQAAFAEPAATVERLLLRTGPFRTEPTRQTDRYAGGDLENAGEPVPPATFNIDDVQIK
jgi:hypothetical protein